MITVIPALAKTVIPAKAGIQGVQSSCCAPFWVPAYAGMTTAYAGMTTAYAGMTTACAGMTTACAGITGSCVGMTTS